MNSYKQHQVTHILVDEFLSESYQCNIEDDQYYLRMHIYQKDIQLRNKL